MARRGERAREALLDAAEQLFATHGIDSVSNRRIAEQAGQSNHSAVGYHFGGREELLRALIEREHAPVARIRAEMFAALAPDAGLMAHLQCMVLPSTRYLASLPAPTWRARLQRQLAATPSAAALLEEAVRADDVFDALAVRIYQLLSGIPEHVLAGRRRIVSRIMIDVSAEYETRVHEGVEPAQWDELGYFLTDACAGLLSAPVSHPGTVLFDPA